MNDFYKKKSVDELKVLKSILEHLSHKNNDYKPLEQKEIDLIENIPFFDCVDSAFLNNISDKVMSLVKRNLLGPNYKTIICKDKISIFYVNDLNSFDVVRLDLNACPPELVSIIYDMNLLKQDIINIKNRISALKRDIIYLISEYKKNNAQDVFLSLQYEIADIENKIIKYEERKVFLENLERNLENIDFKDLNNLRKILESDLGLDLNSRSVHKNIIIDQALPKERIYRVGKKYPIKYIHKTKKPGE